jgi:hypothetical protein
MLSLRASAIGSLLLFAAVGCKKEIREYRLTAEQLAWQPYRVGDVLRFGQARSSKVRTFSIVEVDDRLIEECNCGGIPILGGPTPSRLQQIRVDVRRTDTVRYVRVPGTTPGQPDSVVSTGAATLLDLRAGESFDRGQARGLGQLFWEYGFYNYLNLNEVIANQPQPDTTTRVLPSLQVGGITYGPVIQLSNSPFTSAPSPRTKPTRRLYYAKGVGVVAFLEGGTLWYRLP